MSSLFSRAILFNIVLGITLICLGQTTTSDGDWQSNGNWNAAYPGSGTDADGTLDLDGETINFDNYMTLGSFSNSIDVLIANSNRSGGFIVNDTLVIYGNLTFENRAMPLTVTANGVLIVFGNLTSVNQITVASEGLIVVTEQFAFGGGQASYGGGGNVYAGSYGGGTEAIIDDSGDGDPAGSTFTIDDLSTDGFETVEEFVDQEGTVPLPVDLLYFKPGSTANSITWATATELNNDYFSIQRSENGSDFYEIAKVAGNGTSNQSITYSFTDESKKTTVAFYRLKQVDFDGSSELFEVIRIEGGITAKVATLKMYPTIPKNGLVTISSETSFQISKASIIDLKGGTITEVTSNANAFSDNQYALNVNSLKTGIYLLQIETSTGIVQRSKVIIE